MEVQKHGKIWETEILNRVYGATRDELASIGYGDKFDLPGNLNRLGGAHISVKTTGRESTVDMADCLRLWDAVKSGVPFHVVVIIYEQKGSVKKVTEIVEVDLTSATGRLFGWVTRDDIEALDFLVKMVPQKRKPTPEEHARMYEFRNEMKARAGALNFNIKCNSTQSRLQCSFSNFRKFLEENPERVVARSKSHEFRGGAISAELVSGPRVFKKKATQ
jgi:hypothetical protein